MNFHTENELRELNQWIHEHIFGWKPCKEKEFPHRDAFVRGDSICIVGDEPQYATDLGAAMQVLEKCSANSRIILISQKLDGRFIVTLGIDKLLRDHPFYTEADTLPLAIAMFSKKTLSCKPHWCGQAGKLFKSKP